MLQGKTNQSPIWCRNLVIQTIYVILVILSYFSVLPIRQKQAKWFKFLHRWDQKLLILPFILWAGQILPVLFGRKWLIVIFWSWFMIIKVCPLYYKVSCIYDCLHLNQKIKILITFLWEKNKTQQLKIFLKVCNEIFSTLVTHLLLMYLFL